MSQHANSSTATTTTSAATIAVDIDGIVDRYLAVWSIPDDAERSAAVADLWTEDGVEFVEGVQFRGREALVARVAEAHTEFIASGLFTGGSDGHVTVHDDVVMFTIQLRHAAGEASGDVAWAARVFLVLDDRGFIVQDYHVTVQPLITA